MSLTFSQTQGNGSTLSYLIVAKGGYFEDTDIVVELITIADGTITEQTKDTDYTIENNNVIFTVAPTSDYYVRIRRSTDNESTYSDFTRGNAFGATNLNNSFLYALYQMQQLADGFRPDDFYWKSNTNAGNQKLINLADGENPGDAVNYGQVEELIEATSITSQYADEAAASAAAAAASAAEAGLSEDAAAASATTAEAESDNATSAANIAVTAKNTALTYSTNASTSASNAATSASAAASSATSAGSSATAASGWASASSTSASSASSSASAASTYASDASNSATSAAGSATSASSSAAVAAASAVINGFHPTNYGAVGDGTTDDTVAIQACIDAADAAGVPVIISKLHKLTDQIDVPDGISILGHHRDTCGFKVYRADFNLSADAVLDLTVTDKYAARLENFQITTDMDTTNTVRANLTAFPPLIRAVSAPRFFLKNLRLNRAYVGIDATGNSGGCHISDCEIGAYNTGLKLDSALDFVFIDNVEFWPFGIADTDSEAIYADGNTIAIDAVDVDGLAFGNISTFWCKTNLDGCFGTIGTLNLDGNYSQLNITATNRKSELSVGALYKTTAAADDWCLYISGTYASYTTIGSAWMKNGVNITGATETNNALVGLNQASSDLIIGNLRADIVGSNSRLAWINQGHFMLSNTYINVDSSQVRSNAMIRVLVGEASITNLKASTSTTSPVLVQFTSNYRHSVSNVVAPGWQIGIPSTCTLAGFSNVHTDTTSYNSRLVGNIKTYVFTGTFDSAGTAIISHSLPDYTKVLRMNLIFKWASYNYQQCVNTEALLVTATEVRAVTGDTSLSGSTCKIMVEVEI